MTFKFIYIIINIITNILINTTHLNHINSLLFIDFKRLNKYTTENNKHDTTTIIDINFINNNKHKILKVYNLSDKNLQLYIKKLIDNIKLKELSKQNTRIRIYSHYFKKKNHINHIKIYVYNEKYFINNIYITGNNHRNKHDILHKINIKKGEYYNETKIFNNIMNKNNKKSLLYDYMNQGFIMSNISIYKYYNHNRINLKLNITEGEKFIINNINFIGNDHTSNKVVIREILIKPGQFFSLDNLLKSIINLYKLNIFINYSIIPILKIHESSNTIDIIWYLKEKNTNQINIELGLNTKEITNTINIKFENLSINNLLHKKVSQGDGEKLYINTRLSRNFHDMNMNFIQPVIDNQKKYIIYNINVFHNKKQNIYFKNITNKIICSIGVNNTINNFHIKEYINYENIYNIISKKYKYYNSINYNMIIAKNTLHPNYIFPINGLDLLIDIKITPLTNQLINIMNKNNYNNIWIKTNKIKIHYYWYKEFYKNIITKIGGEIGFIEPELIEKFYTENYPINNIQDNNLITFKMPDSYNKQIPYHLYNQYNIFSKIILEFRTPLITHNNHYPNIWGILFTELGYVHNTSYNEKKNYYNFKKSIGIGIRTFIPYIKFVGIDVIYGKNNYEDHVGWYYNIIFGNNT
jgi:outer membrane protein insertion porin family